MSHTEVWQLCNNFRKIIGKMVIIVGLLGSASLILDIEILNLQKIFVGFFKATI